MKLSRVKDIKRLDVPLYNDEQNIKDCKKATPCNTIRKNDIVFVKGKSLLQNIPVNGYFKFDSYDKYDNNILDRVSTMTLNFSLVDVYKVDLEKGERMPNIEYFKTKQI